MVKKYSEEDSIHKLYQIVYKKLIAFIRSELEPYDFNRGEFPLLFKLVKKGDGVTQKEITDMLYVSKSTTSKMINNLVDKGYLRKEKDPVDKRATRIYLTEKKDDVKDLFKKIDERAESKMLEGFEGEEKEELRSYLERILENLQDEED